MLNYIFHPLIFDLNIISLIDEVSVDDKTIRLKINSNIDSNNYPPGVSINE